MRRRKFSEPTPTQTAALKQALDGASLADAYEETGLPVTPRRATRWPFRVLRGGRDGDQGKRSR
jgi:hypothetical protein